MRTFSYMWSLPVTWQKWWSHHSILHSRKPYATHKLHVSVFYRTQVIAAWNCGKRDFLSFLVLWPWSRPNDLHMQIWPVSGGDIPDVKYEFPMSRLSKVIIWQTDRHIWTKLYRSTGTTPLSGRSKMQITFRHPTSNEITHILIIIIKKSTSTHCTHNTKSYDSTVHI